MLAHSHQNWNNQHWSHAIFAGESRVSFYHSANPVSWMQRSPSLSTTRRNTRAQPLQLTRVNSLVNIRWALQWRHNGHGSVSNHQAYPDWTKVMVDHKTFSAAHEGCSLYLQRAFIEVDIDFHHPWGNTAAFLIFLILPYQASPAGKLSVFGTRFRHLKILQRIGVSLSGTSPISVEIFINLDLLWSQRGE